MTASKNYNKKENMTDTIENETKKFLISSVTKKK
jgi:hypothetical protein